VPRRKTVAAAAIAVWANYGTIMKDFTAKYGIKINDANPDGSARTRSTRCSS
jgi:putative spermidine/putrescine transport system substrate-binding protein